jgi:UDP-N-acetylglucosamine/UDP-N-acetylgalactosamine diphosphorylase
MLEFQQNQQKIQQLVAKGVTIPNPASILVGDEVDPERISGKGVVLYAGCRLFGASTFIADEAQLGLEAPVSIHDCQIGPQVRLKGGFFKQAAFLKQAVIGSGAHVREGTILEEQANAAHTVGLKQTILFPYVTLGSLINFCDCLMSGGTDRQNHSEVGSAYIHFNYTPNQDKATPTLLGNVPQGVMLDKPPIFLGGQGGIVGPCRLGFGTVIAAGTIQRKDEQRENRLLFGSTPRAGNIAFVPGQVSGSRRIIRNNINYIANLLALRQWYLHVRSQFVGNDLPALLLKDGLLDKIDRAIEERMLRLKGFLDSGLGKAHHDSAEQAADLFGLFEKSKDLTGNVELRDHLLDSILKQKKAVGGDYLDVIKSLSPASRQQGTQWLQSIVDEVLSQSAERSQQRNQTV